MIPKQKIVVVPTAGSTHLIVEFIITGKWMDDVIYFQSISNTYNHVNNRLNLTCKSQNRRYFNTTYEIIKTPDYDKFRCEITINHNFNHKYIEKETVILLLFKIPYELIAILSYSDKYDIEWEISRLVKDIFPTFWVPKFYKNIILSPLKPTSEIFIKTRYKLKI